MRNGQERSFRTNRDAIDEDTPRKPRPSLDLSDMSKFGEPEDFLKASKKGQSVMMFVRVSGSPTR